MSTAASESEIRLDVPIQIEADGTRRIGKTRVTLDVMLGAYKLGESPEQIVRSFPSLNLAEVLAVLAWYVNNRTEVDGYLAARERAAAELRKEIEQRQGSSEGLKAKLVARMAERKRRE